MFYYSVDRDRFACVVTKSSFLVSFLFIFSQIKCNSGQAPPTMAAGDLEAFVAQAFSQSSLPTRPPPTTSTPAQPTPSSLPSRLDASTPGKSASKDGGMMDYEELVGSIFYQNASLNEPDVIIPCDNGDLGAGECTHFYQCSDNRTILTDGSGKSVINFRIEFRECPLLMPCCSLKSNKPIRQVKNDYVNKPPGACGLRNRNGIQFVIKDPPQYQAEEAEFPWTVAILERNETRKSDEDSSFLCGGSLIHPQVVMTAAHCLVDKSVSSIFVRAGEWDSLSIHEFFPHQDRDIQETIVHEQFISSNGYNDIALLVLKSPVEIVENVNTICLPPLDYDFSGQQCFASGWGTLSWKERHFLSIMKRIELPVVEHSQCEKRLRKTRVGIHFILHESFICAGGEKDVDTCRGDGGSPLACPIPGTNDQYYQSGIVSWGIGCGGDVPAVYVSIPHLRKWIDDQMIRKKFDISAYDAEASKKIDYRHP